MAINGIGVETMSEQSRIGETATVIVDGAVITGTIYNVRDNGWPCVETDSGRIASGPEYDPPTRVEIEQHALMQGATRRVAR